MDRITSDSAGTGTAYFSGQKVNIGNLLVNANVFPGECDKVEANKLESILHKSIKAGTLKFPSISEIQHSFFDSY